MKPQRSPLKRRLLKAAKLSFGMGIGFYLVSAFTGIDLLLALGWGFELVAVLLYAAS